MKLLEDSKRSLLIILPLILCASIFLICSNNSDKVTLDEVRLKDVKEDSGMFAIMVQQEANSDNYTLYEKETWPTDGYTFNSEKSGCLDSNGKKISDVRLNYAEGKVKVETGNTSYCYIYFDKKEPHSYEDLYVDDTTLLGSTDEGNDGYLIYHDGTGDYGNYEAGDKSYRFSGNNPDNYVCLDGNTSTNTCSPDNLYRVIGWFPKDGNTSEYQMKLIKSEYITTTELGGGLASNKLSKTSYSDFTPRADVDNAVGFYWSGESSINYNNWKLSKLNEALNNPSGTYLQSLKSYTNLIEDTKWYIGGNTSDNITQQNSMKKAYDYELGDKKLTEGSQSCVNGSTTTVQCTEALLYEGNKKVGLMYATEYGYASAPSNWSKWLYSYDNANNRGENWLYNGVYEWTLSRRTDNTNFALRVSSNGHVNSNEVNETRHGVRPVFVLKSNATVKSGDGSKNSPWRINLQSS